MQPEFNAFPEQTDVILCNERIVGVFCGKRAGKTETGAIKALIKCDQRENFVDNGRDPYIGIISAPTRDMLKKLSMQKFLAYADPLVREFNKTEQTVTLKGGQIIYGVSADRPRRAEGIRASFAWIDEVFQVSEQFFLEMQARVADQRGQVFCTGSLGVQYVNPKNHWAYDYFKKRSLEGYACFEWPTAANPYFPKDELERLRQTLDAKTFKAMFEISWDIPSETAVYELTEKNIIRGYKYNPSLATFCSIDWGWTHPMACLFFQHDHVSDTLICFDEIVSSKMKLEELWSLIKQKGYHIHEWWCDPAGLQTREQTGLSNIDWFKKHAGVTFRYEHLGILNGVAAVRALLMDGSGRAHLVFDEQKASKTIAGMKRYSYASKDGKITSELPVDEEDDEACSVRYLVASRFNRLKPAQKMKSFNQMGGWV